MPELIRKRVNDRPVTWHVHYAGVRVGVIVERSGALPTSDQWEWHCGFYAAIRASSGSALRPVSRPRGTREK
jgi:hypothetical protein